MSSAEARNDERRDEKEPTPTIGPPDVVGERGSRIGPYKQLSVLGEGGFAVVYLAEQQEPVKRRVALKVIKAGMDTKQVIARFEAERQALALLDHPHIAHIFDAGTTEAGRPYFAMEYVQGVPITEHCDRCKLTIEERLRLFLSVCDAVQHAHQKAIIHRDIKPSNILVAYDGEQAIPMIIDFGLAKALSQPLTERTLVTEQAQMIGTPEYMSPEQAEMTSQDIDTRTDIYSLGVLLYELLIGTLPLDPQTLREGGPEQMRRMIREQDPQTPSVRLSSIEREESLSRAAQRRTDVRTLGHRLHGELDWITLKAMDKDRTRRYQTAHAFAEDIRRHLNDEPVLAGPPSTIYRLNKFLRRHRTRVRAAALVILLFSSMVTTSVMYVRARHRDREALSLRHRDILANVRDSFSKRDLATAMEQLEPILNSRYVGNEARLLYAGILIERGDTEGAEVELRRLVQTGSEVAGIAHLLLARIYWESNISENISEDERTAKVTAHKQSAEALLTESADSYFLRALTTLMIKEKLTLLDNALESDLHHFESRRLRTWTYYASRRFEDMEDDAIWMTASRPETPEGYTLLGIAQRQLGKFDKAIESFRKALQLPNLGDPQRLDLYHHWCETYLCWGDYHRLTSEVRRCSAHFPSDPNLAFYSFCAHVGLGEYEEAMSDFRRTVRLDPNNQDRFILWSMKHVSDTLAVGGSWHPEGTLPEEVPFICMQEVERYYRDYISKKARRIVTDGFDHCWSPDGKRLAFTAGFHGNSGLAVLNIENMRTELLTVGGRGPRWSPDGHYIAFIRDRQVLPLREFAIAERRGLRRVTQEEIWLMRADGTEARRLVGGASLPSWSPDSQYVYYETAHDRMLYKISVNTPGVAPEPVRKVSGNLTISPNCDQVSMICRYSRYHRELQVRKLSSSSELSWRRIVLPDTWKATWTPSGGWLCTMGGSVVEAYPSGVWIYSLQAGQAIKSLPGWAYNVQWSAGEKQLAVALCYFYEIWTFPPTSLETDRTESDYHEMAIAHYNRLTKADAANASYYENRAWHRIYLGYHDEALKDVEALIHNQHPKASAVCCGLATLMVELERDWRIALSLAEMALEQAQSETDRSNAVNIIAEVHYGAGNWDKTIEVFSRNASSPAGPLSCFRVAIAHWHLGNREKAFEWYRRAVEAQEDMSDWIRESTLNIRAEAVALMGINKGDDHEHDP